MPDPAHETVDVVMPCYNGAKYVTQALESAVAQTHKPRAIIVVDDGSTDDSAQVVRDLAAKHADGNIQLIQQSNAGEPAARNTGIATSTATWVAQLDTDDWWEPNKLELQLAVANDASAPGGGENCVLVHTGVIGHFPDGSTTAHDGPATTDRVGHVTRALLEPRSIGHPSIMVRRSALDKIGGYDAEFKQACDLDLYFRLSVVGTFAFVPEYLLHYRYHAGQMSASQMAQVRFHHKAIHNFVDTHPDEADAIGRDVIRQCLARHVAVKLQSMYWRRLLDDFRALLEYAADEGLTNEEIEGWRKRARWPDWVIRLKDRLTGAPVDKRSAQPHGVVAADDAQGAA